MRTTARNLIGAVLGLALAGNGVVMLAAPAVWYGAVPGVGQTGPLNPHFVRDIGAAYVACGAALSGIAGRRAVWFAAGFLGLHALIHLWEAVAGREAWAQLAVDLPGVFLPPAVAIWIAWPRGSFPKGVISHDPLVP